MDIARASQPRRKHAGTRFSSTRRAIEQLDGRRVLVTGASGFIGGRVCERLAAAGVDVTGTSRSKPTGNQGVRWLPVDLSDAAATREAVRTARPDVIMHLAGAVWGSPDSSLLERTIEANLLGTVNLLTAAQHESTSRVIVTGTMMEPDFSDAEGIANSPYAASKWASSIYARMFHALYDLPVVILRLFMVYGPGDSDDRKLIPHVIHSLLGGREPELSSGRWEVDWVYVEDAVDAYICAGTADGAEGHTVDVGSGEIVSVRHAVETIAGVIDNGVGPRFGARPDRPNELTRVADVRAAWELIGWRPGVSLAEGLERTVAWHAQQLGLSAPGSIAAASRAAR